MGLTSLGLLLCAASAGTAGAATVGLGSADTFGVLGGSTVTNTGPTVVTGDVGVTPGTAITGFVPGIASGVFHADDGVARQAQIDSSTAFDDAAGRIPTETVTDDLAGRTLTTGVFAAASSMGLTGDLTLDAEGQADATFVFQVGTALTIGSGSRVLLVNGAQACNVFWEVGSSATVGTGAQFVGNVLARASVTMTTGATLDGRALAQTGAVTLDTNVITRSACTTPQPPPGGTPPDTTVPISTPPGTTPPGSTPPGSTPPGTTGERDDDSTGPLLRTGPVSDRDTDDVLLTGRVTPGPDRNSYGFQYGRTDRYGKRTPLRRPDGTTPFTLRSRIGGLRPGTRYHYRLYARRPDGSLTYGRDRTFTTPRTPARDTGGPARSPRLGRGFTG